MEYNLHPVERRTSFRIISADIKEIIDWFEITYLQSGVFLSQYSDYVIWSAGYLNGADKSQGSIEVLEELRERLAPGLMYLELIMWKQSFTTGRKFALLPEEKLSIQIDLQKNEIHLSTTMRDIRKFEPFYDDLTSRIKIMNSDLPTEHEYLRPFIERLIKRVGEPERNIFLIIRFSGHEVLEKIALICRDECSRAGYNLIRADEFEYTDDLWDNVLTHIYSCNYGIAVFDQINQRDFNPNVALEVGFMMAQRKRILLLKDRNIPAMPTDIVGKIYRAFDTYDVKSVAPQIQKWLSEM